MPEISSANWAPPCTGRICVTRQFQRLSPVKFYRNSDTPKGWIVISYQLIENTELRRKSHGKICRIRSDKASIYRVLRYSVNLRGSGQKTQLPASIVVDWAGWIELDGLQPKTSKFIELTIETVPWYAVIGFAVFHPDQAIRLASYLGIASILLGILSVALAVVL